MKITCDETLIVDEIHAAWEMYVEAFREISTQAVQAHTMDWEAFVAACADRAVQKWRTFDDAGLLTGLAVVTNDLAAWPLVSPEYFKREYPQLYAQDRIWYVGFVCVRQDGALTDARTFSALVNGMKQQVRDARGLAVMDFCSVNVDRGLVRATARIAGPGVPHRLLDAQEFHTWDWSADE
jgi:hypothetical protein